MGVWIETTMRTEARGLQMSHPVWVCGLKLAIVLVGIIRDMSHPVWVCGLKRGRPPEPSTCRRHTLYGCVD